MAISLAISNDKNKGKAYNNYHGGFVIEVKRGPYQDPKVVDVVALYLTVKA